MRDVAGIGARSRLHNIKRPSGTAFPVCGMPILKRISHETA